jgi:hypothetical protein
MNKYFVVYRVPVETMQEWKKNTSPEEMKAQGEKLGADMMAWTKAHEKNLVDKGQPLGKTKRVTSQGVEDTTNDLNYCCIVEAESHEAAAELFKDNPHLQIPTSYVDVMEIPHMGL